MGAPSAERSGRLGRRIAAGLGAALARTGVLSACLALSAWAHVAGAPGREAVRGEIEFQVSELLAGSLEVREVSSLRFRHVELRGVTLRDPTGERVASIDRVTLRPDLSALLDGEISIGDVELDRVEVSLREEAGELALLSAVAFLEPSEEEASASDPMTIRLERVGLRHGALVDLPDGYRVSELAIEGRARLGEDIEVHIIGFGLDLSRDGAQVARLDADGELRLAEGEQSRLTAAVVAGDDRVSLDVLMRWGGERPADLTVDGDLQLSPELLRRIGQDDAAAALATNIEGTFRIAGALEDLAAEASLHTDGGDVALTARLRGENIEASLETAGLALGELSPAAPPSTLAGRVSATLAPDGEAPEHRRVTLTAEELSYDDYLVPALSAEAVLEDERGRLVSLALPHLTAGGGHLDVEGEVGFDGEVDVHVDAHFPAVDGDVNVQRLAPGVRGGARLVADARIEAGDDPRLMVDARAVLDGVAVPGATVRHAVLLAEVRGRVAAPRVDAQLSVAGVRSGELVIDQARVSAVGGPERYHVVASAELPDTRGLSLDANAVLAGEDVLLSADATITGVWPAPIDVQARDLRVRGGDVRIGAVTLASGPLRADLTGAYHDGASSDLRAHIAGMDLAVLDRALGLGQGLRGTAGGELVFTGSPLRPEVVASGDLDRLLAAGVPAREARWSARYSTRQRRAEVEVHVDAEELGRVDLELRADLAAGRPETALRQADFQGTLVAAGLSSALVPILAPEAPAITGTVDANITLGGQLGRPSITASIDATDLSTEGVDPLALQVTLDAAEGICVLELRLSHEGEELATVRGRASLDLPALIDGASPMSLLEQPWSLAFAVPEQHLTELPAPARVDIDGTVSLLGNLAGGDGRPTRGDVRASVGWQTPPEGAVEGCELSDEPAVARVTVRLEDNSTTLDVVADLNGESVAELTGSVATPVDGWLQDGLPERLPEASARMQTALDLRRTPFVCGQLAGDLALELRAEGIGGDAPTAEVSGRVHALRVAGTRPVEVRIEATATSTEATVSTTLHEDRREAMRLSAEVPITWGGEATVPEVRDERWHANVHFDRSPLAPLLSAVPLVADPSGRLGGDLDVTAFGEDIDVRGELVLSDVSLTVTDPVQRVEGLEGTLAFTEAGVSLREIQLRDRDGVLRLNGDIGLDDWRPTSLDLDVRTRNFPARYEGVIFAYLTTRTRVEAELTEELNDVRVNVDQLAVQLPEQSGRDVQPLDAHPEVLFEDHPEFFADGLPTGQTAGPEDATDDAAEPEGERTLTPTRLAFHSRPFWVRHETFAVQLSADLNISNDLRGTRIDGPVVVRRGFLELLGKSFELERGELRFGGGADLDPLLDIGAVHTLRTNETVTVHIGGHLTDPELEFTSSVPDVVTEREVIELLVRGRTAAQAAADETTAQQDATALLAGMTAGLLTGIGRRELGGLVPVLSLESQGNDARLRVGFQAEDILPDAWRSVIQGVYVEGFAGAEGTDGQGAQYRSGFLIELMFPHDIVTTGAFEQPSNFSIDVTWEP